MGRKLDLSNLTEDEQSRILQVIQRDFDLRKNETKRLGHLNDVTKEETRESDQSKCVNCGTTFMWIFHPKVQCRLCQSYFCKNSESCGVHDVSNDVWFCLFCHNKRQIQLMTLDWFYSQLKGKFRRHGGAKIVREFYKRRKNLSTDTPPEKPPRTHQKHTDETSSEGTNASDIPINKDSSETEVGRLTDASLRAQIEETLAAVLVPKLDEIKGSYSKSSDKESLKLVEEVLEKLLHQASNETIEEADDALMWRYLKDHKQSVIIRIMRELTESTPSTAGINSSYSSVRDVETMTDASDSEIESLLSASGSLRSRPSSSQMAPLSDRLSAFEPDSMVKHGNQVPGSSQTGIIQSVWKKDEIIAEAEIESAMAEIFKNDEKSRGKEFSTELKFTAVGVEANFDKTIERNSSRSESESDDYVIDDNWVFPGGRQSLALKKQPTYVPVSDSPTAYEHARRQMLSTSYDDVDNYVIEDSIEPVNVKKNLCEVDANNCQSGDVSSFSSIRKTRSVCDVVDDEILKSLNQELNAVKHERKKINQNKIEVDEKKVIPPNRSQNDVHRNKRNSDDSAYSSDVSKTRASDSSSLDGSIKDRAPRLVVPERFSTKGVSPRPIRLDEHTTIMNQDDPLHELKVFQKLPDDDGSFSSNDDKISDITGDLPDDDNSSDASHKNARNDDDTMTDESSNDEEMHDVSTSDDQDYVHDDVVALSHEETQAIDDASRKRDAINDDATNNYDETHNSSQRYSMQSSVEDETEMMKRKTINDIVQELKDAGLRGDKTQFKRSSLNIQPRQQSRSKVLKESVKVSKRRSTPARPTQELDFSLYGFTVDPAKYKKSDKPGKVKREVSISSLVLSDSELASPDEATPPKKINSSDQDVTSIPSVAQRRSIFAGNDVSRNDVTMPPRFVENDVKQEIASIETSSKTIRDNESDVSSATYEKSGYDADNSVMTSETESSHSHSDTSSLSRREALTREELAALPSVVQRRSLFLESKDSSSFEQNKARPIIELRRAQMTSLQRNSESTRSYSVSDVESIKSETDDVDEPEYVTSNVPDKIDPDIPRPLPRLGTNNISSDPPKHVPSYDVRMTSSASSMTSSKNDEADSDANSLANEKFVVGRKNISLTSENVLQHSDDVIAEKRAWTPEPEERAKNFLTIKKEFDRGTPLRGSLTMRGSRAPPPNQNQVKESASGNGRKTLFTLKL
ncbi:unnamed protein product [Clavelina lepadiformis]|uniref:RabBD domain-containing protein n=1 Tax=Clavelina lepadiformis TaxID=159417 RepID=A0ABP0F3U6_CLALP